MYNYCTHICMYIFIGDFNFEPQSLPYRILTGGSANENDPDCPISSPSWSPSIPTPLRSAYGTYLGHTSSCTCYRDQHGLTSRIDHIFCSDRWSIRDVLHHVGMDGGEGGHITGDRTAGGSWPNEEQPSDHVLIGATLDMPPSTVMG